MTKETEIPVSCFPISSALGQSLQTPTLRHKAAENVGRV